MDLWHQKSFEIPELHSMLLFVADSSFSLEVKASLKWVLQDRQVSPRTFISRSATLY